MTYEKFYGKLWKQGESLVITIPSNYVKFGGYNEGDEVVVMVKRKVEEKV